MAGTKAGAQKRAENAQQTQSAGVGRRDPSLLLASPKQEAGAGRSWLVVAKRPIKHGERTYQPGDTFPDGVIDRIESWLRTGRLVRMS